MIHGLLKISMPEVNVTFMLFPELKACDRDRWIDSWTDTNKQATVSTAIKLSYMFTEVKH